MMGGLEFPASVPSDGDELAIYMPSVNTHQTKWHKASLCVSAVAQMTQKLNPNCYFGLSGSNFGL
jgi:hypothetical protein